MQLLNQSIIISRTPKYTLQETVHFREIVRSNTDRDTWCYIFSCRYKHRLPSRKKVIKSPPPRVIKKFPSEGAHVYAFH